MRGMPVRSPLKVATILAASLMLPLMQAQQQTRATGSVAGHVLYADTQGPARLATVTLQPLVDLQSPVLNARPDEYRPEGVFHLITTALDGSFRIPDVPPGLYYVIVEQAGFVSPLTLFTREQLNHPDEALLKQIARYMTPVSVTAGHTSEANVSLVRGAVLSGTVRFEDGSPVIGARLVVMHRNDKGKWVTLRTNGVGTRSRDFTDDQGTYRFTGLPAGEYLVRAGIELTNIVTDHIFGSGGATSWNDGYHLQIFPGDAFRTRDAKPVKVAEGEAITSEDIDVPVSKLYSLTGVVERPNSASVVNSAHLTLTYADDGTELNSTDVNENDGSFRFDFVPGGKYVLKATSIADVQRTEVQNCKGCMPPTHTDTKVLTHYGDADTPVELTGDLTGVVLHAAAGSAAHP